MNGKKNKTHVNGNEFEKRGVTVTDSEPLDGASAHEPVFQMFID